MFVSSVFITCPNWKQAKCLSPVDWIEKSLYKATKVNKLLLYATIWTKLTNMSHAQKNTNYMSLLI